MTASPPPAPAEPILGDRGDEVSPLELFFDLVFVFAVSQLSEHLVGDLTWRGAAETAVLLIAVFGIWSFTSWGVSFPQGGRYETASIFAVLLLALFTNASIPRAFGEQGWTFAVPFLMCLVGQAVFARATATAAWLREHYRAQLTWTVVEAALWIVGLLVEPDARLGWWAAAALLNVGGAWTGHPLPGRRFRSGQVQFQPDRMVERSRLFLLIALGECVLTIGTAIAAAPVTIQVGMAAGTALVTTTTLWFLYFRGSDTVVNESARTAVDRLRVARIAVNSQLVVLAGLVALAVGSELAVEDPLGETPLGLAVVLHAGPLLYLTAQTWYLHALGAGLSRPRLAGIAVLAATAPLSTLTPPLIGVAVVAAVMVAVTVTARRDSTPQARTGAPGPADTPAPAPAPASRSTSGEET